MNTYIKDNLKVELDNNNEIFIEITDKMLDENIKMAIKYEEYRNIAESFEYIEEMRKINNDLSIQQLKALKFTLIGRIKELQRETRQIDKEIKERKKNEIIN